MKKKVFILMLIALCLLLCSCGFRTGTYADGGYTAGGGSIAGRVENIEINWVDGAVDVAYYDGDEIRLSETTSRKLNKDAELRWKLDGETLRIEYAAPDFRSWVSPEKQLTVMLPEGLRLNEVKISAVSARVQAGALLAGEVQIQSVSGDVQLRFASIPERIQANAVSGNVTISLPENAGFKADVDSVSGNVGGSLPVESRGDGRYTYGDEQCSIDIDTVSGNVWFNQID